MKFGIIFCGYNTIDTVAESIKPWLGFRIAAISLPFKDYEGNDDGTQEYLRGLYKDGHIDYFIDEPEFITETKARTMALDKLRDDVDYVFEVDSDEIYSAQDIQNIIQFVEDEPFIEWFKVSYKNYIFDNKTYLLEPFCPPRIFKVNGRYKLGEFYQDNHINFQGPNGAIPAEQLPNMTIPKQVAWVPHYTWPSNERGKCKAVYQQKRWGGCSFRWDEDKQQLEFNENYYKGNYPKYAKD